jgi:hypothetical protein
MRTNTLRVVAVVAASALAGASALATGTAVAGGGHGHGDGHHGGPKVVVDGLDNPRQLAVDRYGALYVAEAGSGGTTCEGEGEDQFCIGDTSRISKVKNPGSRHPQLRTVLDELPSGAGADGSFATGTNGVSVARDLRVYGVNSGAPDVGSPNGDVVGTAFKVKHDDARVVADIAAYEEANDPDGQGVESNPYSVLAQHKRLLVADAAGNTVLAVDKRGDISVFAVFPNINTGECTDRPNEAGTVGCDFVPTALAAGKNGSVYVTGLASEAVGEGRVVKLSKHGQVLREWSGFTTPVGIAVRHDGTFYVSELFANADFTAPDPPNIGQVTKVRGDWRSSRVVPLPAGVAIADGKLYVAAYSVAPAVGLFGNPAWNGQVWKLSL